MKKYLITVKINLKMRVEKYFAYKHLPQHLQDISRPFCETSKQPDDEWLTWLIDTVYKMSVIDHAEKNVCVRKLLEAKRVKDVDARLRLILEAKDCAVRAAIPN